MSAENEWLKHEDNYLTIATVYGFQFSSRHLRYFSKDNVYF